MKKYRLITFLLISLLVIVSAAQADTPTVSLSYNGTAQTPAAGSAYGNYYCSLTSGTGLSITLNDLCGAVSMTDAATKNYYYATGSNCVDGVCTADFPETNVLNIAITPVTLTLTPDANQSKYLGQPDPVFTYTAAGAVNNETPAFSGALSRDTLDEIIGSYTITQGDLALADNDPFKSENYTLAFTTGVAFAINDNPYKPVVNTGLTYTGSAQDLLTAGTGSGTWYYLPAGSTSASDVVPQGTDAGDYIINCWFVADSGNTADNYWSQDNPLILTTSIAQAAISATDITVPTVVENLTYNGMDQTLINAGACAYGTMLYKIDTVTDYSDVLPAAAAAGTYTISYYVQADTNHTDTAAETIQTTIASKALDNSMIVIDTVHFDNDGSSHTATFTVTDPDCGELTENTDWTVDAGSVLNASTSGIYTVTINGTGNYTGTASAEWVVDHTLIGAQSYKIKVGESKSFTLLTELQNPVITWSISDETVAEFVIASNGDTVASKDNEAFNSEEEEEDLECVCSEDEEDCICEAEESEVNVYYAGDGTFFTEDAISEENVIFYTNAGKAADVDETGADGIIFYATEDIADAQGTSVQGNSVTLKGLKSGVILLSADINGIYTVTATVAFTGNSAAEETAPNEITFYLLNEHYYRR